MSQRWILQYLGQNWDLLKVVEGYKSDLTYYQLGDFRILETPDPQTAVALYLRHAQISPSEKTRHMYLWLIGRPGTVGFQQGRWDSLYWQQVLDQPYSDTQEAWLEKAQAFFLRHIHLPSLTKWLIQQGRLLRFVHPWPLSCRVYRQVSSGFAASSTASLSLIGSSNKKL